MLPVPGDLPVFLELALEVIASQRPDHLVEVLVIPDRLPPGFADRFDALAVRHAALPLRFVGLMPIEHLTSGLNDPFLNAWLQFVRGIGAARATHALLHDADLFITHPDYLKTHYETCAGSGLACLGARQVWDRWYRQNGFPHVAATWELMMTVAWARSFEPSLHRASMHEVAGRPHPCDTTLFPQVLTAPELIRVRPRADGDFVHFAHVICTYRYFQKSRGPYEDTMFRLLLVRLLIDAWDRSGWAYELPALEELARGLADGTRRVTYVAAETGENYASFRRKLQKLMESALLDHDRVATLSRGIRPFDDAFGWRS
jgi:hypothetical protein